MELLYTVSITEIERCEHTHVCISKLQYVFLVFTLGVRDTSASSVQHPLCLLCCVCFEIVPYNSFGVVILFYLLLSSKLPIFIRMFYIPATYYPCPFFSISFSTVLSIFEADKMIGANPEPFCIRFVDVSELCRNVPGSCYCNVMYTDSIQAYRRIVKFFKQAENSRII